MKLVMFGAPGAGKGTQADLIAQEYGIPHISTGDIFRANIKQGTPLGKVAKEYIDKGQLVPDELTIDLLMNRIAEDDCQSGYILDGFPRTIPQAEALDKALPDGVDAVIDIEVPDEAIIERMGGRRVCPTCGASFHIVNIPPKTEGICDHCGAELIIRDDDKPETVKQRLATYHKQTEPLKAYYSEQGKLDAINGNQAMEAVFSEITKKLG